jgi:hypothetical protein
VYVVVAVAEWLLINPLLLGPGYSSTCSALTEVPCKSNDMSERV